MFYQIRISSHLFLLLSFLALKLWLIAKTTILTTIPANSKHTHLISNNLNIPTTLSMHLLLPLLVTLVLPITVLNYTVTLVTMTKTRMLTGTPSPQSHIRAAILAHKPTSIPMKCPKSTLHLQFLKCHTRDTHKVHIPYNNHNNILHVQKCIEMAPLAGLL